MTLLARGTLFLVGDSFGGAAAGLVPQERAWPSQVEARLASWHVESDFAPYRRFADVPALLAARTPADLIIIVQAGIVDSFPRPLPFAVSRRNTPPSRALRRVIRPIRGFWMRHVFRTTWTSGGELNAALDEFARLASECPVGLVTVVPPLPKHSASTPMAHDAVLAFNDRLREFTARTPNTFLIDLYVELLTRGYLRFVNGFDGHLNARGNDLLASAVIAALEEGSPWASPHEEIPRALEDRICCKDKVRDVGTRSSS